MARKFTPEEAIDLIDRHQDMLNRLNNVTLQEILNPSNSTFAFFSFLLLYPTFPHLLLIKLIQIYVRYN